MNNNGSVLSNKQRGAAHNTQSIASDDNRSRYVTTEPRAGPFLPPFRNAQKPDKKLRATTLPRNQAVSEKMNEILSNKKEKDRIDFSDRGGNFSALHDQSQTYHSGPNSPVN